MYYIDCMNPNFNFDFDRVVDRYGTYSIKYDPLSRGKPKDVIPMWVADMDFPTPLCVQEALAGCARHGIFGYSEPDDGYFSAVRGWFERRFGWSVEDKWLSITPGVVNAIYIAVRAFTKRGAGVLIQQPVYYPFESAVKHTGRELLVNELVYGGGKYGIDWGDFEDKAKRAEMFILCNPHNPVGRVWTRDELMRMGEICLKYGLTVVSDEIHQDFVYKGHRHLVFSELDKRFAGAAITCTAPSKTFNLAGLPHANIFIANDSMRRAFRTGYASCGLSQPSVMGIVACKAAYEGGAQWLDELISYLSGNMALIREFLPTHAPKVKFIEPEGTYLAWLDFSALGLSTRELDDAVINKAGLWLNSGPTFGMGGAGFQRMNVGCPRSVLRIALERLNLLF